MTQAEMSKWAVEHGFPGVHTAEEYRQEEEELQEYREMTGKERYERDYNWRG